MMEKICCIGNGFCLAIQQNGSLFATGKYETAIEAMARKLGGYSSNKSYIDGYYWDNWQPWNDLMAVYTMVSPDYGFFVGLKKNGRTVATGYNGEGQCDDINSWYDIKALVFFHHNAIGLTYSGEVVCSGSLKNNVIWQSQKYVKKVCVGNHHVSLLKTNGTVSILSFNDESVFTGEVQNTLGGIVDIYVHGDRTYAIHNDGRVSIVGNSEYDETSIISCVGIKKIICEYAYTVALNKLGSLVFAGKTPAYFEEAKRWGNIVDFFICNESIVGISSKGEILITNRADEYFDDYHKMPSWKYEWGQTVKSWRDIVTVIDCGCLIVGVTSTGQFLFSGDTQHFPESGFVQSGVKTYSKEHYRMMSEQSEDTAKVETDRIVQERKQAEYRRRKVCQYCGGGFKGFIVKSCSQCGRRKDY